jgi:hypothetical protein
VFLSLRSNEVWYLHSPLALLPSSSAYTVSVTAKAVILRLGSGVIALELFAWMALTVGAFINQHFPRGCDALRVLRG